MYALTGVAPWFDYIYLGALREKKTDGLASAVQQKDAEAIYMAHKGMFNSQTKVRRAIINALNLVVIRQYKRTNTPSQIGAKIYKANDDPHCILDILRYNYGKGQPSKKTRNNTLFNTP